LVRVSVSSTNTCPPPKVAAYSTSATYATTTGMRWQKAWRGALWATGVVWDKRDGIVTGGRHGQGTVSPTLSVTFWGWVKKVGWGVS
jgi:hypothetical protein